MKIVILSIAAVLLFAQAAFAGDITVQELHDRLAAGEDIFLVQIYDGAELEEFNLGGKRIPHKDIEGLVEELKDHRDDEIVLYNYRAKASGTYQLALTQFGFANVRSLIGGLVAWIEVYGRNRVIPPAGKSSGPAEPPKTPSPIPEKSLDKASAEDLVAEATDWLSDLIDDDDAISAITEKWNSRNGLAGKTRAAILKLLLDDAKAVIADKAELTTFINGWNSKTNPKPAGPKE